MAFTTPGIPLKRRSSSADTPSVNYAGNWPSSLLAHSSPTPVALGRSAKRVNPVSRRGSIASAPQDTRPTARQEPEIFVPPTLAVLHDDGEGVESESHLERIMAIDMRERGSVGCCYYVAAKEALYLLEDVKSGSLEIIDLRAHVR